MKPRQMAALATLMTLAFATQASAHAEFTEPTGPAGGFALVALQVPNEKDDAATVSVSVQIPEGIDLVRFVPKPGWTRRVTTQALSAPTQSGDDQTTERISEVTWSGGAIAPGEIDTFEMSVALPDETDRTLTFPTVQSYEGGEAVRWIGPADSDEPAPTLTTVEGGDDGHGTAVASGQDTHADGTSNVALGVGIAGLVAGLGALAMTLVRRRPGAGSHA